MKIRTRPKVIAAGLLIFAITAIVGVKLSARSSPASKTAQKVVPGDNRLVVHEWGTFTSIAGKDGVALEWRPLNGSTDLPKFVYTIQEANKGLRHTSIKDDLIATVRMETPVLYFYTGNEMDVSVKVDFPKGKITEWYPQARGVSTNIDWGRIRIMPAAAVNLPVDYSDSYYYPARETDAALVQVCAKDKPTEQEKFLFYRGVGTFELPLSVRIAGEKIVLRNSGEDEIAHLIVFQNRAGRIGYRTYDTFTGELTLERPALDKNITSLLEKLKGMLVASGLYEKEADAMIKTWSSSWFEEGMRVFYVLPRQTTDAVLPITIEPHPAELVRVLVGRAEVITPEMEKSVQRQVSMLGNAAAEVRETAAAGIRKYGRFSEPILKRILEHESNEVIRKRVKELIETKADQTE